MTNVDVSLTTETIADLLDDWRIHLRARNRRPETIKSYLAVARAFCAYLERIGHRGTPSTVHREHVEAYLADMTERVSAATVAKHECHQVGRRRAYMEDVERSEPGRLPGPLPRPRGTPHVISPGVGGFFGPGEDGDAQHRWRSHLAVGPRLPGALRSHRSHGRSSPALDRLRRVRC